VVPAQAGLERVGDVGFFPERCRDTLWAASLAWLREALANAAL
jgi:hypothetical protein